MRLTTKCRYGVKAIIEIAQNFGIRPTKRKEIVVNQNIPESFLENILIELKRGGLVNSIRGAKGGFLLSRSPNCITILSIVSILQTPLVPVDCVLNPTICARTKDCLTRPLWKKMYEAQEGVLQQFTVTDLLEKKVFDGDCLTV